MSRQFKNDTEKMSYAMGLNVAEYIARVDEMAQRKRALIEEDGR